MEDHVDQTEEDVVTGVDLVDGVLEFRRHDGSVLRVLGSDLSAPTALRFSDPIDLDWDSAALLTGVTVPVAAGESYIFAAVSVLEVFNGTAPTLEIYGPGFVANNGA